MGAGKAVDKMWFLKGRDMVEVMDRARRLPQVKKKDSSVSIKLIKEITMEEYINGLITKRTAFCMPN